MGIDLWSAGARANELYGYAGQLQLAKNQLNQFKSTLGLYWQGEEESYYITAIDQALTSIDSAAADLNGLGADIVNTANQIHEEEMAALRAAIEAELARQAAIREAAAREAAAREAANRN